MRCWYRHTSLCISWPLCEQGSQRQQFSLIRTESNHGTYSKRHLYIVSCRWFDNRRKYLRNLFTAGKSSLPCGLYAYTHNTDATDETMVNHVWWESCFQRACVSLTCLTKLGCASAPSRHYGNHFGTKAGTPFLPTCSNRADSRVRLTPVNVLQLIHLSAHTCALCDSPWSPHPSALHFRSKCTTVAK